jgi:hypothetical protein
MLANKSVVLLGGNPKPTLDLNFAANPAIPAGLTATRSTVATVMAYAPTAVAGDLPLLTICAINEARFTNARRVSQGVWSNVLNDGSAIPLPITLLAEEARTNLCLQSEVFKTTWANAKVTINNNAAVAPDGTLTADSIIPDNTSGLHIFIQEFAKNASIFTRTFSVYAKPLGYDYVTFRFDCGAGNGVWCSFNISTGVVATVATTAGSNWVAGTATITQAANGFYRCSCSFTPYSETSNLRTIVAVMDTNGNPFTAYNFAGNTTSGAYFWGAQLEANTESSSYIPTTTVAVIRTADVPSFIGAGLSWYNAQQGTFAITASGSAFNAPYNLGALALTYASQTKYLLGYNNNAKSGSTYLYKADTLSNPTEYTGVAIPTTVYVNSAGIANISRFTYYPKALKPSKMVALV